MSCLKLCTTCTLAGLIRCPSAGTPLPLVEAERPLVVVRRYVYPPPPANRATGKP